MLQKYRWTGRTAKNKKSTGSENNLSFTYVTNIVALAMRFTL